MMSLLRALDELEPGKGHTLVHRWALSKCWLLCCDCLDSQQEEKRLWAHGGWDWAARSWMGSCTQYGSRRIRYRAWVKLQTKLLVHLGRRKHDITLYFTRKLSCCSMRKEGRKGGLKARRLGLKWQWTFWSFLQMPDGPAYWSQVLFLNVCLLFLLRAVSQLSFGHPEDVNRRMPRILPEPIKFRRASMGFRHREGPAPSSTRKQTGKSRLQSSHVGPGWGQAFVWRSITVCLFLSFPKDQLHCCLLDFLRKS